MITGSSVWSVAGRGHHVTQNDDDVAAVAYYIYYIRSARSLEMRGECLAESRVERGRGQESSGVVVVMVVLVVEEMEKGSTKNRW